MNTAKCNKYYAIWAKWSGKRRELPRNLQVSLRVVVHGVLSAADKQSYTNRREYICQHFRNVSIAWKHPDKIKGMYTINPNMPKVRMSAVNKVRSGWGVRKTARYMGVSPGTITKWCRKAEMLNQRRVIPTQSSRPHHSPNSISDDTRWAIYEERLKYGRCGAVVHKALEKKGIKVSLSTVNRTLDGAGFLKKKSKWKRYHRSGERPLPLAPGDLVELDTIHYLPFWYLNIKTKWYVFTAIDIHTRIAYAKVFPRATAGTALEFLREFKQLVEFNINCIQTDHGSEFSRYFTQNAGIRHRHIRVRQPNDNAHLERFNRTIQEECISKQIPTTIEELNICIGRYLKYYNNERLHMGLNFQTPREKLTQAIA